MQSKQNPNESELISAAEHLLAISVDEPLEASQYEALLAEASCEVAAWNQQRLFIQPESNVVVFIHATEKKVKLMIKEMS